MDNLPTYHWRALAPQDIPLAREALRRGGPHIREENLARLGQLPAERLAADSVAVFTSDGSIAAAGITWVFPESENSKIGWLEGAVHPDHTRRGLGSRLLSMQMDRAIQKAGETGNGSALTLRGACLADNPGGNRLFEKHGFSKTVTQCQMRFDLAHPLPSINLPEGMVLLPYSPERDDEMRCAFNLAFAGHWIGELDPGDWRERFIDTPQFKPELTKLALTNDMVAGFYLSEVFDDQPGQAWLEIVGVLPEWRGRGMGTALTSDALHVYRQAGFESCLLGVDDENITNAKRIYANLGFTQEKATRYFSRNV